MLPGAEMRSFGPDLDALAELGVPQINVVSLDPDRSRTFDQFAALAEPRWPPGNTLDGTTFDY